MSSSLVKVTEISEFVKEDSLKKLFSFIGDLRHVSLKRSKSSSTFEAVIDFIQPEDAKLALHLDGLYLLDRNLHLELYKDEDQLNRIARTLRVDHVPFQHTLDGLKTVFEAVEGVRRMRLGNGTDKDTHLGYAYVEFVSSEHAQLAMRKLDQVEFQGQKLRLSPSRIAISKGKSTVKTASPTVSSSKVRDRADGDYDRRDRPYYDSRNEPRERRRSRAHSRDPYRRDQSYDRKRRRER